MATRFRSLHALGVVLLFVVASAAVHADTRLRRHLQNGSGVCQAALPAVEGLVRKRPLAIQNESDGTAFVSCSLVGPSDFGTGVSVAEIGLINNSGSVAMATCTLVSGIANGANEYFTRTVSVPTTGWRNLGWTSVGDNGGENFDLAVNASCNLPAGVGISYTITYYNEDIGD